MRIHRRLARSLHHLCSARVVGQHRHEFAADIQPNDWTKLLNRPSLVPCICLSDKVP
ncbi:hypothetical protein L210DRAFT_3583601 [Boletus edulis BED1]|uniref:Uncharacterized protein n=1 Tax=Boletus edulis BED1 TaxID=1328754 RepID=A0AAD4BBS9_BOLED|nr:hypothetical protein L210DRAFT_3583601 [Boletus edulis BED1]